MQVTGRTKATSSHESGRPCGCDPAAWHVCSQHRAARDFSETEIDGAYRAFPDRGNEEMVLVVTGPDDDGHFAIMGSGGEWSYLPRFVAEALIEELQRRLSLREDA